MVPTRRMLADKISRAGREERVVLQLIHQYPGMSIRAIAEQAGWVSLSGKFLPSKVYRLLQALCVGQLAKRKRGKYYAARFLPPVSEWRDNPLSILDISAFGCCYECCGTATAVSDETMAGTMASENHQNPRTF